MRRPKVVQLSKELSASGGVGTYLLHLCTALENAGQEVIVIHADPRSLASPSGVSHQFYVEKFDEFEGEHNGRTRTSRVMEILETVKPDIVHIQGNNNFLLEDEIRRRYPAVKSLHVYDFCPSGNKFHHALEKVCRHPTGPLCIPRMVYKRCLLTKRPSVIWWHYRRCVEANRNNANYRKLIVASEFVKRQAVATGYPAGQIEVVPYFTPLPERWPSACEGERGHPGLVGGTVLFVGRVVREKGLDHLLSAFSQVRTSWRLLVAGDGPDLGRAKRLARRLRLDSRIEFAGWADRELLSRFYREASLVVLPSIWPEPFGLVGIEAMSYEKPVVAFKVGGIPEWLQDGVTGFLISPFDVREMAERINYLLEHPEVAQKMGMKGRARVEREFSEEKHMTRLLNIYEAVRDTKVPASVLT